MIDVHQVVELALGHSGFGNGESEVTRVIGKSSDRRRQQWAIAWLERTDGDDAAVSEFQ